MGGKRISTTSTTAGETSFHTSNRRIFLVSSITTAATSSLLLPQTAAFAYDPDPDKVKESLYLMSRVQEATLQQERLVRNTQLQETLQRKMNLSLKLVSKSYRVQDQINFCSQYVNPEALVEATMAGNQAVQDLQSAIDFVKQDLGKGELTKDQKEYLFEALSSTRENLFVFLDYMPQEKVDQARLRVEEENKLNRKEFDLDSDAAIFNPVTLPWKNR
jgi:hypothetical protein